MKALFISYNQALQDRVADILDKQFARGFTRWDLTFGRGTSTGEPHYGNHAWPAMNTSVLSIVEDHKIEPMLKALKELDASTPQHGLRAFVWNIEDQI